MLFCNLDPEFSRSGSALLLSGSGDPEFLHAFRPERSSRSTSEAEAHNMKLLDTSELDSMLENRGRRKLNYNQVLLAVFLLHILIPRLFPHAR